MKALSGILLMLLLPFFSIAQDAKEKIGLDFIQKLLVEKEYEPLMESFDPSVKSQINPSILQQASEGISAQLGAYQKNLGVQHQDQDGFSTYYYYSQFENQSLDIQISFSSTDKIVGFFFVPHQDYNKKKAPAKKTKKPKK